MLRLRFCQDARYYLVSVCARMDKSLIANLNGFKREFAFFAASAVVVLRVVAKLTHRKISYSERTMGLSFGKA